jgi:predicted RNase H-like HicB family nuclease
VARRRYVVTAVWDEEARVWVAESDDVPGLITEAETSDELIRKLQTLVPELLELNGHLRKGRTAPLEIVAQFQARAELPN